MNWLVTASTAAHMVVVKVSKHKDDNRQREMVAKIDEGLGFRQGRKLGRIKITSCSSGKVRNFCVGAVFDRLRGLIFMTTTRNVTRKQNVTTFRLY